jgi:hypothetical protein
VGSDHQPPAIPAVGGYARRQRAERRAEQPRERDEAGSRRRPRQCENEQRIGDRGYLRTAARQELRCLEQQEVTISAERGREHVATLAHDPVTRHEADLPATGVGLAPARRHAWLELIEAGGRGKPARFASYSSAIRPRS